MQLFISVELGTECSIAPVDDNNDKLGIKGKYLPRHIETLLRKYLTEFVDRVTLPGGLLRHQAGEARAVRPCCAAPASDSLLQGPHNQADERGVQQDGQQVLQLLLGARLLCPILLSPLRRVVAPLKQTAHTVTKADRKKEKQAA